MSKFINQKLKNIVVASNGKPTPVAVIFDVIQDRKKEPNYKRVMQLTVRICLIH
jgi:hypothetical protein